MTPAEQASRPPQGRQGANVRRDTLDLFRRESSSFTFDELLECARFIAREPEQR
jgi:hypothetical protein